MVCVCVSWFLIFSHRVIFSLIINIRSRSIYQMADIHSSATTQHAIVKQRFRFLTFDSLFMLLIRIPREILNSLKIVFRVCNFFRTTVTSLVSPPPSTYFLFIYFFQPKKRHTQLRSLNYTRLPSFVTVTSLYPPPPPRRKIVSTPNFFLIDSRSPTHTCWLTFFWFSVDEKNRT